MSKLVTGLVKVESLDMIREAAQRLGWPVDEACTGTVNVRVVDPDALYRPRIACTLNERGTAVDLAYDNWMGGRSEDLGAEHRAGQPDSVTTRVIGQFKQAIAQVEMERLYTSQRASWRVEKRQDGAVVMVVGR